MEVLDLSTCTPFAEGGNRLCFVHPHDNRRCVKVMKPGRVQELQGRASWYKRWKPENSFDDNCREAVAHEQPALADESAHEWQHLARWYGWIDTSLGSATVTELVRDGEGRPAPTLETLIRERRFDVTIEQALHALTAWLLQHHILTKNLLPHNIVQAADGSMKIIDGLGSASFLPLPASGRSATRRYILKRISKMWRRINWERAGCPGRWRDVQHHQHLTVDSDVKYPPAPAFTVLVATQNFPPAHGGIQSYMHELCLELGRCGIPVAVLADAAQGDTEAFDSQQPFSISRHGGLKPQRRRLKARRLTQLVEANRRTVVICDSWKSLELLEIPSGRSVTTICLAHGMEFPNKPSKKKTLRIITAFDKADFIFANSDFTRRRCSDFVSDSSRLKTVLPGISEPAAPSETALQSVDRQLGRDCTIIVTLGRLEARKGQDKVIQALASLSRPHDFHYVIIGQGPDDRRLRDLVAAEGLEQRVTFTGPVDQDLKHAWLSRADIFAMPSRIVDDSVEGFGIVYLEAAWFGLPSIAGEDGGAPDAVIDQKTGLLVDGSSTDQVRQAIETLLFDTEMRRRLGRQGRQRVEAELLWPAVAQRMLTLADLHAPSPGIIS